MASEEQWRREGDEETKRSSGEETVTIRSNGEQWQGDDEQWRDGVDVAVRRRDRAVRREMWLCGGENACAACNRYLSCSMAFFPTKPNSWAIAVTLGWTGLDSFKLQAQS
ncbi:hypothetical protein ACOSQ4_023268 [Xanthoceras sorbifolium]